MSFDFDEPYIKERGMKTSEIVKVFRLVLGLSSREALKNLKFQQTVLKVWYPPNFPFLIARQKAPRKAPEDGASDTSWRECC